MLRRFFSFVFFRVVPVLLIAAIVWSGWQVAQAVNRQITDQQTFNARSEFYVQTATALSVALAEQLDHATATAIALIPTSTNTSTSTSTPEATATFTASATFTDTPTDEPTNTPKPTNTNTVLPELTLTPSQELSQSASLQLFVTNTPEGEEPQPTDSGISFTTNTPVVTSSPQPTDTETTTPTDTIEPTTAATEAPAQLTSPVATFGFTPPAVTLEASPTILFADNPAEGATAGGTAVPTAVTPVERRHNLTNILLLGQDNELTGEDIARTDTMIILSINRDTGTVAMLSLPRDLYVYLPNGSMQRLNVAYGVGEAIGWAGGGFFFMRQTLLYNLGINVHYYAMVDLSGFAEVIDAVDGVNLSVDCPIQDYLLYEAELPDGAVKSGDEGLYILPVGYYEMTGRQALWYARSRHNSDDFDRGRRQQQILRAGWRKARDTGLLANLPNLWNEAMNSVETDLPFSEMVTLIPIALNLDPNKIENFRLIRTYHTTPWQTPDGDYVQIPNADLIRDLLNDFYTPPTENQISVDAARIKVINGTSNEDWDFVAADRLAWDGFNAIASGAADNTDYATSTIIDYTGQTKGGSLNKIAEIMNVPAENIILQPDANREYDFEVIVGANYNSCTGAVLPVENE